jgi:hypothetical protein
MVGMLITLHAATLDVGHLATVDDLTIPYRQDVQALLARATADHDDAVVAAPTKKESPQDKARPTASRPATGPGSTASRLWSANTDNCNLRFVAKTASSSFWDAPRRERPPRPSPDR